MRFAVAKKEPLIGWDALAFEMREQIYRDNELIFDSGPREFIPNQLTNDGQANMLNVWARGTAADNPKWLMLLNQGTLGPSKASTFGNITEAITINTNGYARQCVSNTDWTAPALASGDQQMSSGQKTFGQFTGNVPVTHVALASAASQFSGTLYLYVPTAYFTANAAARTFVNGESYLVTLQDKQQ